MSTDTDSAIAPEGPIHVGSALWCTACRLGVFVDVAESSGAFFSGQLVQCPRCQSPIDLLEALDQQIVDNLALIWAYGAIGAITSVNSFELAPDANTRIRFADWGIPEQATILSVNYLPTSDGGCFPLEVHSNTPRWAAPNPTHAFLVYGRGRDNTAKPTRVNCSVTWFCAPDEDDGWDHLLEAFRSLATGRRERLIIPAHIAVESALSKAIVDGLRKAKISTSGDLGAFARQTSVLLPLLADRYACPRIPIEVEHRLNRLRQLRNKVAHNGASSQNLQPVELARLLTAATLGFHYGRFLRSRIEAACA